jgi:anti-sigma B factor antagonist
MADITDPLPSDRARIGAQADAPDTAMRSQVAMSTRECAGQVVVALSGEVDATNAEDSAALIATVAARVPWLIVDLTGLTFIDCAGLRALAAAARQARQAGGGLVLAAPAPLVLRMFDLTGLMTEVPVCATVDEAAGIASPRTAARTVPGHDARAHVAALPAVRPERQQEEGQRDPHQQPAVADTRPDSS